MSDPIGCEVCHGLSKDGYTLERYGDGFRCQSHVPRNVIPTQSPVEVLVEETA